MTAYELLKKVYRKYEGDVDYPDFEDEDMELYFDLLKDSIDEWAGTFPSIEATLTDAVDGDKTIIAGKNTYNMPIDTITPPREIYIGDQEYNYITQQEMAKLKFNGSSEHYFTVTGSSGAYTIEFLNPIMGTISYAYTSGVIKPTGENSLIMIPRPDYCYYYILSSLYIDDPNNRDLAQYYEDKKDAEMKKEVLSRSALALKKQKTNYGFGV